MKRIDSKNIFFKLKGRGNSSNYSQLLYCIKSVSRSNNHTPHLQAVILRLEHEVYDCLNSKPVVFMQQNGL